MSDVTVNDAGLYLCAEDGGLAGKHVVILSVVDDRKHFALLRYRYRLSLWLIGTVRAEPETVISRAWVQSPDRQNKLFQDYWRACFEINFSDRQEGLTVSSIICDR